MNVGWLHSSCNVKKINMTKIHRDTHKHTSVKKNQAPNTNKNTCDILIWDIVEETWIIESLKIVYLHFHQGGSATFLIHFLFCNFMATKSTDRHVTCARHTRALGSRSRFRESRPRHLGHISHPTCLDQQLQTSLEGFILTKDFFLCLALKLWFLEQKSY